MEISSKFVIIASFISLMFSFSIFLKGFMPAKSGLPGHSTTTTNVTLESRHGNSGTDGHKRLVIVLIDALRADFVLGSKKYMTYTTDLIKRKETLPLVVISNPPTVTLPRIKALMTGTVPGFVDVVMNFGSQTLTQDNLLAQFQRAGKKLLFFGDDTWIKLFPTSFSRADGTNSFFVTDYTEVDRNISRHLPHELEQMDWDVMILHYLGLDHIGHLSGPNSPLVKPKLEEMDSVVKEIHQKLLHQASAGYGHSLLLLCGDHGMTDQGGHGGSSASEVTTPAIFISTKFGRGKGFKFEENSANIQQIDITPSLALLFDLPIPKNNLGILIPQLFHDMSIGDLVRLYQENSDQLWRVLQWNSAQQAIGRYSLQYEQVKQSTESWFIQRDQMSPNAWERRGQALVVEFQTIIKSIQENLTMSLSNYDLYAMGFAIVSLWLVLSTTFLHYTVWNCNALQLHFTASVGIITIVTLFLVVTTHMIVCTSQWRSELLCGVDILSQALQILSVIIIYGFGLLTGIGLQHYFNTKPSQLPQNRWLDKMLLAGLILHSLSLMSSSFVEEEHQTWYFFCTSVHIMALVALSANAVPSLVYKVKYEENSQYSELKQIIKTQKKIYQHSQPFCSNKASTHHDRNSVINKGFLSQEYQEQTQGNIICTSSHYCQVLLAVVFSAALGRICRSWNQTGNKWLDQPDIGDWLVSPENKVVLSVVVTMAMVTLMGVRSCAHEGFVRVLFPFGLLGVYTFRVANGSLWMPVKMPHSSKGNVEAITVYSIVFVILLESLFMYCIKKKHEDKKADVLWEKLHTSWILFMALVLRPHNVVLLAMIVTQERLLTKFVVTGLDLSTHSLTLLYLWMGQAAFFYQGNSNSVSSVDVSAGFIGLVDYQPIIIGILMALSTYAGVIFWLISLQKALHQKQHAGNTKYSCHMILLSRSLPLAFYTTLVSSQRYHLFVWTVFSPKLLYEGMLTVILAGVCFLFLIMQR